MGEWKERFSEYTKNVTNQFHCIRENKFSCREIAILANLALVGMLQVRLSQIHVDTRVYKKFENMGGLG